MELRYFRTLLYFRLKTVSLSTFYARSSYRLIMNVFKRCFEIFSLCSVSKIEYMSIDSETRIQVSRLLIQYVRFVYASVTEKRNVALLCIEEVQNIETHLECIHFFSKRSKKLFSRVPIKMQEMKFCKVKF